MPGLARSYVTQLNSPDFKPQKINRGAAVISMGSGNNVRKYIESVENINSDWFPLTGMETQNFGGFGGAIAIALQNELIRQPVKGVSSSIQICYVKRGGVGFAYPEVRVDVGTSNERIVKAPP